MKPDELIRDWFPVESLRLYLSVHTVLTNILVTLPESERDALGHLNKAIGLALPNSFKPTKINFCALPYNQHEVKQLATKR